MARTPMPRPILDGYEFRPLTFADLPELLAVILAESRACGAEASDTLSDLEREMEDPWSPPATDTLLALDRDGAIVGMARAYTKPDPIVADAFSFLALHLRPDQERLPVADALFTWCARVAEDRLRRVAGDHPAQLRVACDARQASRADFFATHHFRIGRNFWRMRRDLSTPIDAPALPDGVSVRLYQPEQDAGLMAIFNETFGDHWGFEPIGSEDWRVFVTGSREFRPDLTPIVFAGDRIVGYSINQVNEEECARLGERRGWIAQLGVRREWRKRGIATALLNLSMRAFREAGLESAVLGVDSENLTGAVGLYERAGFRPIRELRLFVRDVAFSPEASGGDGAGHAEGS